MRTISPRIAGSSPACVNLLSSISEISPNYDAFILDQYGVLHNGQDGLEGAAECVTELFRQGKKLIILSNTSGTASVAMAKLPRYGFDPTHFLGAVTSGEESSKYIRDTYGSNDNSPKKALWFTWDGEGGTGLPNPMEYLSQCGNVVPACTVDEADFLLAHGAHVWQKAVPTRTSQDQVSLGSFFSTGNTQHVVDAILENCVARGLPMVCANPDFVVRTPIGSIAYMPGNIARRYQELGGTCRSFGKPAPEHFLACLDALEVPAAKAIHVGDSLHHDISGANAAGIDSLFITSGIHCEDLGVAFGFLPQDDVLVDLLEQQGHIPTHAMAAFRLV